MPRNPSFEFDIHVVEQNTEALDLIVIRVEIFVQTLQVNLVLQF